MYEIIISQTALKDIKKLEKSVQERILTVLERIRIRPEAYIIKLVSQQEYKMRAGDYRIILDIAQSKSQIHILKVGHRKNVYDTKRNH